MPIVETILLIGAGIPGLVTGNIPLILCSTCGLASTGPIAGGLFATCQSCNGPIQAGSCMANIQSYGMTTANTIRGVVTFCPP